MQPFDFFIRGARLAPQRWAAIEPGSGRRLTHAELLAQSSALAAAFQELTGKQRPVVAILAGNSIEMLLGILATYAAAGVLVPLTPTLVEKDIARQLGCAQPDLVLCDPAYDDLLISYQGPRVSSAAPGQGTCVADLIDRYAAAAPIRNAVDLSDTVAIKFTGGSSGVPKGVLQSFRCINTMVASLMMVYGFDADERFVMAPPMTHGAGTFVLPVLGAGGCLIVLNKPTAAALHEALQTHQATSTWIPPTLLHKLVEIQTAEQAKMPCLKNLLYGGAPCTLKLIQETLAHFGPVLGTTYGLTEAPVIMAGLTGAEGALAENLGSAGRIGPLARVAVINAAGQVSSQPGELGEIIVGGDLLMSGYLNMPEQTQAVLKDGWFHTGDLGYVDERGFVFIKGRSKDMVISGGFNVYPADVEEVYAQHEHIAECLVFGVDDELWGERVEMAVVLIPGSDLRETDLIAFGKQHLGSVRTPKAIHFLDHFPKNELGKVNKRLIVDTVLGKHTQVET